jgi:hypothetical protein
MSALPPMLSSAPTSAEPPAVARRAPSCLAPCWARFAACPMPSPAFSAALLRCAPAACAPAAAFSAAALVLFAMLAKKESILQRSAQTRTRARAAAGGVRKKGAVL